MTVTNKDKFFHVCNELWICLLLVLATTVVYNQVSTHEFINLDTDQYVYDNNIVKEGLTPNGIRWAFSTLHVGNWHPITWLSHMLDVDLYGLDSGRHHLTNVLFHIVNTLLLFIVFRRMTDNLWQSGLVAALFALHPLHAESVAWIAERKDLLSALFGLLAILSYRHYCRHLRVGSYLLILLFFTLSLMAKPMMVTLPFALLLLDYWPLRRFQFTASNETAKTIGPISFRGSPALLIIEKLPLSIISALSCIITIYAQRKGGAVVSLELFPLHDRIANASIAYAAYIGKMFWPSNLAIFYPHPGIWSFRQVIVSCLLLAAISYLAIRCIKSHPWMIVGWLWYLGTLVPVIGLVQVGHQAMADRYTYIPTIGLFIIIAWGISDLTEQWKLKNGWVAVFSMTVICALMTVTWKQVAHWKNSTTVFKHALEATQSNSVAHNNYATGLAIQGRTSEAIKHFKIALEISPNSANIHLNLGLALFARGDLKEAHESLTRALQINPNDATACNYLGRIQNRLGTPEQAVSKFRQAININPDYAEAYNNLGISLYLLGKADQAIPNYLQAIKIKPSFYEAYNNAGAALIKLGEIKKAADFFREAVRLAPDFVEARNNLNKTLAALKALDARSIVKQN